MKVLIQRVSECSVAVGGEVVARTGCGLLLLVGIGREDTPEKLLPMAEKISHMRIFPDEAGRFHYSLLDVGGEAMCVSQFTLFADTGKGRRPDFFAAMKPPLAEELFDRFVSALGEAGVKTVRKGVFGAEMAVSLVNDGPVTILVES